MVKRYFILTLIALTTLIASAKNIVSVNGYTATTYDPKTGTLCLLGAKTDSIIFLTTIANEGITHIRYDAQGLPTLVSTPNGSVSMPHYDNKQVKVSIVKAGKVISETLDLPQREVPKSIRDILLQSQSLMRNLSEKSQNNAKNYLNTASHSVELMLNGIADKTPDTGDNIKALLTEVKTGISKGKATNATLKRMITKYELASTDWETFIQDWIVENMLSSNCFVVEYEGKEQLICPDDDEDEAPVTTKGGSSSLKAAAKAAKAIGNTFRNILR